MKHKSETAKKPETTTGKTSARARQRSPVIHELPNLGYSADALVPFLTAETLDLHHGKHHRGYVDKLNRLIVGTELGRLSLSELVRRSEGGVFNNAAQHFNHSFYWRCVAPAPRSRPRGALATALISSFGSLENLEESFAKAAVSVFGSGWCWIVRTLSGSMELRQTSNAGCPLTVGEVPLLVCDVWEHAYYVDYRNARADYVRAFWQQVNWDFVADCLERPDGIEESILHGGTD